MEDNFCIRALLSRKIVYICTLYLPHPKDDVGHRYKLSFVYKVCLDFIRKNLRTPSDYNTRSYLINNSFERSIHTLTYIVIEI